MKRQLQYHAITLSASNPMPLYLQLAEELHRLIDMLNLHASERMLSERKLAELLSIDRTTVSKAYQELKKKSILISESPRTLSIPATRGCRSLQPIQNIGIILPMQYSRFTDINHGLAQHYLMGILDNASRRNISTSMLQLPPLTATQDQINAFLEHISRHLTGVLHFGGRGCYPDRPLECLLQCRSFPQVFISATPQYDHIGVVSADPKVGGNSLAEQLWELGHKHVGIIYKQRSLSDKSGDGYFVFDAMYRTERMVQIFRKYDLDCDEKYQCPCCSSYAKTLDSLRVKKESGHLPTVFWCINDEVAHWAILALSKLGLRVPEDISVVGFDGLKVYREDALTTINLPFYGIGHRALDLLLELYETQGHATSMRVNLETSLVIQRSLSYARHPSKVIM